MARTATSAKPEVKELVKVIKENNEVSNKQTKHLIILTWVIAILTLLMLIGLILQIK